MSKPLENLERKESKIPTQTAAKAGIGFGCALAIVISWTANKSIGWAIIHGILSWLYVIYYLMTKSDWTWF